MAVPPQGNTKIHQSYTGLIEGETAQRVATLDDAQYILREDVTGSLAYVGESRNPSTPDQAVAEWRIRRITICGCFTTTEYADNGNYTQKWTDRDTIFPEVTFGNTLSTDFDGINDVCSGGNVHLYDSSDAFSVSLWVKPQNVAAQRCLFAKATNDSNVYGFILYHNNVGRLLLQMRAPAGLRSFTFASTLIPNVWQLVTLTYAGANNINGARAYLNDVPDALTPSSGSITNSWLDGQDFTLGARNTAFEYSGKIDEVIVWDKQLSDAQVLELYNEGVPANPSTHSQSVHAMSWYRMGDGDSYPIIGDSIGADNLTMVNMSAESFVEDVP